MYRPRYVLKLMLTKLPRNYVICINSFYTDSESEHKLIKKIANLEGARCEVSQHWLKGGLGAIDLANDVVEQCEKDSDFKFLYDDKTSLFKKIDTIVFHAVFDRFSYISA